MAQRSCNTQVQGASLPETVLQGKPNPRGWGLPDGVLDVTPPGTLKDTVAVYIDPHNGRRRTGLRPRLIRLHPRVDGTPETTTATVISPLRSLRTGSRTSLSTYGNSG